jgi:hypothetical protein
MIFTDDGIETELNPVSLNAECSICFKHETDSNTIHRYALHEKDKPLQSFLWTMEQQ